MTSPHKLAKIINKLLFEFFLSFEMERRQLRPEVKPIKKRSASVLNYKRALAKEGSVSKTILSPYLVSLRGPILLSAAHSTKILRGGKLT